MTAQSLQVYTEVLANPEWEPGESPPRRVNANISFTYSLPEGIRTLSTQNAAPGEPISGLLYVPTLDPDDPCIQTSAPWVPTDVTRRDNLPSADYEKLIAIAPWISQNCTLNYLAAARLDPLRGFFFFLPDDSPNPPPDVDSAAWDITIDGASSTHAWKSENQFPVYAIPGASGRMLMNASAEYSSNMTDVPHGHILTESFDSRDYVRLFMDVSTGSSNTLPSLWIFLLVVLAMLLGIIGSTSLLMHWLQMRRRNSLRRRVANGEVDLEALGIKRLTVPQEILDQLPLYTYGSGEPAQLSGPSAPPEDEAREAGTAAESADKLESTPSTRPSSPDVSVQPTRAVRQSAKVHRPTSLQQPTCAICLDDFIPASDGTRGTIVRELPCQHIFHPECVDTFLKDSSSLCPMCKKTALPTGYCPRVITNAMVRRERMVRQIRPRAEADEDGTGPTPLSRSRMFSSSGLLRLASWRGRTFSSARDPTTTDEQMTEISVPARSDTMSGALPDAPSSPTIQPSSNPRRREWARQRAVAMLGRREAPIDPDAEEVQTIPRWRKALLGIFPRASR